MCAEVDPLLRPVPTSRVRVPEVRIRKEPRNIGTLAAAMERRSRQIQPIVVDKDLVLLDWLRRLRAAWRLQDDDNRIREQVDRLRSKLPGASSTAIVGQCVLFAVNAQPPDGKWHQALGGELSRADYPEAFKAFGEAHGGGDGGARPGEVVGARWLPASGRDPSDRPPFEKYLNDPRITESDDLRTEIYLPLTR